MSCLYDSFWKDHLCRENVKSSVATEPDGRVCGATRSQGRSFNPRLGASLIDSKIFGLFITQ